jgi:hypothetical protein
MNMYGIVDQNGEYIRYETSNEFTGKDDSLFFFYPNKEAAKSEVKRMFRHTGESLEIVEVEVNIK